MNNKKLLIALVGAFALAGATFAATVDKFAEQDGIAHRHYGGHHWGGPPRYHHGHWGRPMPPPPPPPPPPRYWW